MQQTAIKQFIELPWEYGMDKEYGGLYYFLDSGNSLAHAHINFM